MPFKSHTRQSIDKYASDDSFEKFTNKRKMAWLPCKFQSSHCCARQNRLVNCTQSYSLRQYAMCAME